MTSYFTALTRVLGHDHGAIDVVLDEREGFHRAGRRMHGKVLVKVDHESAGGIVELELIGREKSIRKKGPIDR